MGLIQSHHILALDQGGICILLEERIHLVLEPVQEFPAGLAIAAVIGALHLSGNQLDLEGLGGKENVRLLPEALHNRINDLLRLCKSPHALDNRRSGVPHEDKRTQQLHLRKVYLVGLGLLLFR